MLRVVISEEKCDPGLCPRGVCAAKKVCPDRCIIQFEPYEVPVAACYDCLNCSACIEACPVPGAIKKVYS